MGDAAAAGLGIGHGLADAEVADRYFGHDVIEDFATCPDGGIGYVATESTWHLRAAARGNPSPAELPGGS